MKILIDSPIVRTVFRPVFLSKEPYEGCRCERCFWQGSLDKASCEYDYWEGYSEPKCPKCLDGYGPSSLSDEDHDFWNPLFFILHWTLGQVRLRHDKRDFDAWMAKAEVEDL